MKTTHILKFNGTGAARIGRCSCGTAFLCSATTQNRGAAIKQEHARHANICQEREEWVCANATALAEWGEVWASQMSRSR